MANKSFLSIVAGLVLMGCAGEATVQPVAAQRQELGGVCMPGEEMCDFCCSISGGPSSDDCIVRCNEDGTGWVASTSCGWAQNGQFSSSCLDTSTGPICKWN